MRPGRSFRLTDDDLTAVLDGAILYLPNDIEPEFGNELEKIAGIIDPTSGITGHPAVIARELDVPMISDASLANLVQSETTITLDAERGVVYEGAAGLDDDRRPTSIGNPAN